MRLDRLKAFALSLPSTTVTKQWGEVLVFKVGGKMFLLISLDGDTIERISFKATPEDFRRLPRDLDGIGPAPYLARASWLSIEDLAVLPEPELNALLRRSYDLVVEKLPKRIRAGLGR